MTIQEYKEYYSNLLINQYRSKPKAKAHIETLVKPLCIDMIPLDVQNVFDIDTAEGVQLDILGQYVGITRTIVGAGFQKVVLNDSDFRVLVKLSIIKNTSHSTLYDIQTLIAVFFAGNILITDNTIMQLNYFIGEDIGSSDLQHALIHGNYLPKPMAVQTTVIVVPPFGANYFGFRSYDSEGVFISPFNSYSFYNMNYPWLTYLD